MEVRALELRYGAFERPISLTQDLCGRALKAFPCLSDRLQTSTLSAWLPTLEKVSGFLFTRTRDFWNQSIRSELQICAPLKQC